MPDPQLAADELNAIEALIGYESRREGSYLDATWRDVLRGAERKIHLALNADSGAIPTIAFSDDAIDSAIHVLRSLRLYVVDLEIPDNTGYPNERVCIVRIDPDSDVVVCETEDDGSPISNATWAVPINLIKKVTVL